MERVSSGPGSAVFWGFALATGVYFSFIPSAHAVDEAKVHEKALKIFTRLNSVPPSAAELEAVKARLRAGDALGAAREAIKDPSGSGYRSAFIELTVRKHFTPRCSIDDGADRPLNDCLATYLGATRDNLGAEALLTENVVYTVRGVAPAYALNNNTHFQNADARANGGQLSLAASLVRQQQLLPADAVAGVLTLRAWAERYISAGTGRRLWKSVLEKILAFDQEEIMDIFADDRWVGRDVDRKPSNNVKLYETKCRGCHAIQDKVRWAFAYYDFSANGALTYSPGTVAPKFLRNEDIYPDGARVLDDSWEYFWSAKVGDHLGVPRQGVPNFGKGAKPFAQMIAKSRAYRDGNVVQAFASVCGVPLDLSLNSDRALRGQLVQAWESSQLGMADLFALVAATTHCTGGIE